MPIPTPSELARNATLALEKAEAHLKSILLRVDARYLFTTYARCRICGANADGSSNYFGPAPVATELAAWHLFPFFDAASNREPRLIQEGIDAIEELQKAHAFADAFSEGEFGVDEQEYDSLKTHLRLHSGMVRGSAYPVQVRNRITGLFAPFEAEMKQAIGVGPLRATEIANAILFQMEENLQSNGTRLTKLVECGVELANGGIEGNIELEELEQRLQEILERMGDDWVPTFDQISLRLGGLTRVEWDSIAACIGLTPSNRPCVTKIVDIQDRPIFFVESEKAFAAQGTEVLDAIFNFFDNQARKTSGTVDHYGTHVSRWMEQTIAGFLRRIFPTSCIIENACYPNPDRDGDETETDAVVVWGPILIVVEAKGRKVDQRGFRGGEKQLKNTISNNIQDAFFQADRVIRALQKNASLTFKEKHTGRRLTVTGEHLRRVMPISVTLQHLLGIPTRLAVTQKLGLFKDGSYPWSVSIDDLDVITRFAGSPDVFLHFIERRIAHQSIKIEINGDELDIFGHYLDNRLHTSIYEKRTEIAKHDGPCAISFSGGEERFDPFYTAEWYGEALPQDVPGLDVPKGIFAILQELRNRDDDGARFIAFALLGLSQKALLRVERAVDSFRNGQRPTREIRRTTFVEDGVAINVMAHASLSDKEFFQNVAVRCRMEHYRARARATVAIGIDLRKSQVFQTAHWLEGEWEYEPEMEKLLQQDRARDRSVVLPSGAPKLGRNSPCPCGSGLKFKKCCWGKIDIQRL